MTDSYKSITSVPGWVEMLKSDGVPDSNAALYRSVPILFRAVQLRCDALSSVPIAIYKGENEVDWAYPTQLKNLLWNWEASLLLSGGAFGEIVKNKTGYVKDIRYRNPFDMSVSYADGVITIKQSTSGAIWHNDLKSGTYEILYFAEYDPTQDVLPGISAAKAANVDAKLLYAISKFPEMYFEGGAMPVTLLGIDTNDRNEIERIQNWFKRSVTSIKNSFRILGVRAGSITPTTLTPPLKDLTFPELSSMAQKNIAVAFGIKQTLLFSEAANYATAQTDRLSFYEDTIKPRAHMFEDVINTQLLEREGLRMEFKFSELDIFQEDENRRADIFTKLAGKLPTELALDIAGYDLSEEQMDLLVVQEAESSSQQGDNVELDLKRWQRMVEKRVKEGKEIREFESSFIPASLKGAIEGALESAKTVEDVKSIFSGVIAWRGYP